MTKGRSGNCKSEMWYGIHIRGQALIVNFENSNVRNRGLGMPRASDQGNNGDIIIQTIWRAK